jgi:tetratricopeptide (TPR) repeat protein
MVGLEENDRVSALRGLRAQGLVDFEDPPGLYLGNRAAVLAGMDSGDRRRLHMEAAHSAHRAVADEDELARMLLTAPPLGEPWVCGVLRRAAGTLQQRGRHTEAAELLERALREPLGPAIRADVLLEVAAIYVVTNPEAANNRLTELLSAADAPPRALAAAADLLLARGETSTVHRTLSVLYARGRLDAVTRSHFVGLYWLADKNRHAIPVPGPSGADMPHVSAARDADPASLAAAAWQQTLLGADVTKVRDLGLAVLTTAARGPLFPRLIACRALTIADAQQEAREGLDAAIAEADRRRSPALAGLGLLLRCELSLRAGRLESAVRDLAESKARLPTDSWHPARVPALRALEIQLLLARERFDEAERVACQELPPGARYSPLWLHVLYARARLLLCQGRPREALAEAQECGRWLSARGWTNPGLVPWQSLAALAHLGCGEPAPAASLFTEELRLAGRWGTDTSLGWTELRWGLASATPQAARLTERAMRRLNRSPMCQGFARASVTLETAHLGSGKTTDTVPQTSVNRYGRGQADS